MIKSTDFAIGPPRRLPIILACVIVLAGVAGYANSFHGPFVFDDEKHIVAAENIRHLWPVSSWLVGNKKPVVTLSLAINYAIGGLNSLAYHVTNLAIHLCATIILFDLIRRTLRDHHLPSSTASPAALWLAFVIALLWTVHPLQTQSVTYVIQRSESLMGLFFLLTMYSVLRARSSRHELAWKIMACAACALGMACKATIIAAPLVVFAFDFLILTRNAAEALRRRWGLYAGLVVVALSSFYFSGLFAGVLVSHASKRATVGIDLQGALSMRYIMSQPGVILHYLRLVFWPYRQCADYDWPIPRTQEEFVPRVLLPTIAIGFLLLATLWAVWNKPGGAFLGAAFFFILAPSSGFAGVGDAMMEYRMYLPLAAVIAAVVLGTDHILRMLITIPHVRQLVSATLVLSVTATLTMLTHERNRVYANSVALWEDTLATRPLNPRAWSNYGLALSNQGRLEEAAKALATSIRLNPALFAAHYDYGSVLQRMGRLGEAEQSYLKAIEITPRDALPHINLGNVYLAKGRFDLAEIQFRAAIATDDPTTERKTLAGAHHDLGTALLMRGNASEAIEQLRKAIELKPDYDKAYYVLGAAFESTQQFAEAERHYAEAVRLNPNNADARRLLLALPQRAAQSRQIHPETRLVPQSQPAAPVDNSQHGKK